MKTIEKDILSITEGIIVQQVNTKGVMGAGLALQIRAKWPIVYKRYRIIYSAGDLKLGNGYMTKVDENLYVYNMVSQSNYGSSEKYTDYVAMAVSLQHLWDFINNNTLVYFPFMIGCGFGGGDWNIVSKILNNYFPDGIICKLPLDK